MVSTDLLSALRTLNRADKLHVMQFLISELAQQEVDLLKPGMSYPVWSPYNAIDAADAMLQVLKNAEAADNG
ncbi:MAG: hypothetical protein ETSY1_44270 [Candidatus Entotheonella factor]|uniref:Uncharacterized protein n=1 Tax=Entotheonella factor TaxID=1429438 RepID=W4L2K6_ENTF1|nr:MAG: hypothetical protein ETSY1_44270 [Candidatus Entotheonella factor]